MNVYALDSNIISDILKKDPVIVNSYRRGITQGKKFIIPPIVFYEIQRGLLAKNMLNRLRSFGNFCKNTEIDEFDLSVWSKSAEIYAELSKKGKPVGSRFDGDVFIAAYCIVNGYILVTNNKNHFKHIDGLRFEHWK
ncbi:MAG: PIN domain-containing protein [Oscillospiraceae bacterium]|nr:PIN domain-containing protein [Oscillospiraceae bacterium]